MKALFVSNAFGPFSVSSGANQRSYFIKRALERIGTVDVLQLTDEDINQGSVTVCPSTEFSRWDALRNLFYKHCPFSLFYLNLRNSRCESMFKTLYAKNKYDVVVFRYLQTYFLCGAPRVKNMYLDMDDVPWNFIKQYTERHELSFVRQVQFELKYQMSCYQGMRLKKRFKTIFYPDKKEVDKYGGTYLPNIPYGTFQKIDVDVSPKTLLFVGLLGYIANFRGVDHFLEAIWLKIIKKYPNAVFNIVGKELPKTLYDKWSKIENVNLLGFVDSLEEIYAQSAIVICPIYQGSGSNIKVVEALAYSRPCIISDFALRGFDHILVDKEDLLVSKNDEEFVSNISFAFENPERMEQIANHGYMKVKENFSEERFSKIIKDVVRL